MAKPRLCRPKPLTDWVRRELGSVPAEHRAGVLEIKARALHDLACSIQDQLNNLPVFLGDEPLIAAKIGIDKACEKARRAAERALFPPTRPRVRKGEWRA